MTDSDVIDLLDGALSGGALFRPGADEYAEATSPDNSSFGQHPACVVRPASAADVAATVSIAAGARLRVAAQATGHGTGGPIGDDTVLVDTSTLDRLDVDPDAWTARVGAGVRWAQVQKEAERHGLLGLSGSSPTVGVVGYTVGGGIGWLSRPHGLASAALHAVTYVDAAGTVRDADQEELWCFRGGAPLGLVTEVTIGLFPVPSLHAGYLLWPAEHLSALAEAWLAQTDAAPDTLSSSFALLRLPPDGPFPDGLKGTVVVHVAYCSTDGAPPLTGMRDALRAAASPAVDTTGPVDSEGLSQIHLDPPTAVPGRGTGLWGRRPDAAELVAIFDAARVGDGLNMIELRHVGSPATSSSPADGAQVTAPGPFLLHAVGGPADDDERRSVDAILDAVEDAAGGISVGRSAPSFRDGRAESGEALPPDVAERVRAAVRTADPGGVLLFQRTAVTDGARS